MLSYLLVISSVVDLRVGSDVIIYNFEHGLPNLYDVFADFFHCFSISQAFLF